MPTKVKIILISLITMMGCAINTFKPVSDIKNISMHHVHIIGLVDGQKIGQGSGTVVLVPGVQGAVLTAGHVCATDLPGLRSFEVYDTNDVMSIAVIVKIDTDRDLCLLTSPRLKASPAIVSSRPLVMGERVNTVVGVFFSDGVVPIVEHLFVGQHISEGRSRHFLLPTMYSGDSGGGAWRGQELVGVAIGAINHPATRQGLIGVIVTLEDVRSFLGLR